MDYDEFEQIYITLLKRKPNPGDVKAHIHKNKEDFVREVKACKEYNNLLVNQSLLVSIIIPTRNRNHTFIRAIDSCLNQTYKNIQIIICDDSDPSYTVTQDCYNNKYVPYKNIIYIKNKQNLGFCKNINQGLKLASGIFVSLLFDDDYYYETYIEKTINIFKQNPNIGFVTSAAHNLYDSKIHTNTFHVGQQQYTGNLHKYYYYNGIINLYRKPSYIVWSVSPCNYVFKNNNVLLREQLYKGFDERQLKCGAGYDLLFILDNLKLHDYFYVNTEHLVCFDSTQGSFTVDNTKYVIDRMDITIKYWLEHELIDNNIILKILLLNDYNNNVKNNTFNLQIINKVPSNNTNAFYINNIKKNNVL
jgi:glycosyltransferase involved in cell wall biosynthesis